MGREKRSSGGIERTREEREREREREKVEGPLKEREKCFVMNCWHQQGLGGGERYKRKKGRC